VTTTNEPVTTTDEPPVSGRTYLKLALLSAGLFLTGTNAFVIAGLLPTLADAFGTTRATVGYSITVYALVIAVAAPAASILLGRISRTTLIVSGLILMAIGIFITAIAPTIEIFIVGRAIGALGGAVLVPTSTAAGPALLPPRRVATAIAVVTLGFSLATAVGAPAGTALAAAYGWRAPFFIIAGLAVLLAVLVALVVRSVPIPPVASIRQRLRPLRDGRVSLGLVSTLLLILGFNIVYLFSASVTDGSTGGSGGLLALLLLAFGLGSVAGNVVAGPITDRFSARSTFTVLVGMQIVILVLITLIGGTFSVEVVLFALWGATALGATIPIQHRLATIDRATTGLTLSWFTSAQYLGIAIAPVVATTAAGLAGASLIPIAGAVVLAVCIVTFRLGFTRTTSTPQPNLHTGKESS
jgi:DHA1 family inner membrane transport protein